MKQLRQAGERQLGLGFDAGRREDRHVRGPTDGVAQQLSLPDSRVTAKDQGLADAVATVLQKRLDARLLITPPEEHGHIV